MNTFPGSEWTPVKVRGKRHGSKAEKARSGIRRNPGLRKPQTASSYASPDPAELPSSRSQKRRRRWNGEQSRLEQLPAEVMQQIFEYSGNLALPLVSRELASKLSNSQHLRLQLTSLLLHPVLQHLDDNATTTEDLAEASRLLNSKFMTWGFFVSWLQNLPEAAELLNKPTTEATAVDWVRVWSALRPAPGLLPPRKLLSPPFTPDNIMFLDVLSQNIDDLASISPTYEELAQEGLTAAVEQSNALAVDVLFRLGLQGSTELLRIAVADAGCHEGIVRAIIERSRSSNTQGLPTVDLLDPVVWSWAEGEKARGNERGQWLLEFLRSKQDSEAEL